MQDIIQTERLRLRPLNEHDAVRLAQLLGDKAVSRMTSKIPYPLTPLIAATQINIWNAQKVTGDSYTYGIERDKTLIGVVELARLSNCSSYKIGVYLGQAFWSKGYATEAATAVLSEAETSLTVSSFISEIFLDNPAAINVMHKLGLKFKGDCKFVYSEARLEKVEVFKFERDVTSAALMAIPLLHPKSMKAIHAD